jgi:general secretion pathway protein A
MYIEYFHLKEAPFSISPDPRYLYLSAQHREALAHLVFGVESDGGFVLLTGEVGTGKTTICRCLLEQMPEQCDIALILNPRLTVRELLSSICDEFRIPYAPGTQSIKTFIDSINSHLLDTHAKGRRSVLIIDEAQNLTPPVLEQIRLLTNLETTRRKLLQVILLGQPELREILAKPELRQLSQRIIARFHLGPLTKADVRAYINHRLTVAGAREPLFPPSTVNTLFLLSQGIPRLLNIIADRALLGAYAHGQPHVTPSIVRRAAREALGEPAWTSRWYKSLAGGAAMMSVALLLAGGWMIYRSHGTTPTPATQDLQPDNPENAALVRKPIPSEAGEAPTMPPSREVPSPAPDVEQPPAPPIPTEALESSPQNRDSSAPAVEEGWIPRPLSTANERMAFEALFQRWGVPPPQRESKQPPCEEAEKLGFRCMSGHATLDELLRSNHPAVLKLFDSGGEPFFVTLVGIQDTSVTLVTGGKSRQVARQEFSRTWRGEYTVFWRPPPDYDGVIQLGDRGRDVAWVRLQLAVLKGRSELPAGEAVFDGSLMGELRKFQTEQGLAPDGEAGPLTLIRLNALTGLDVPLLVSSQRGA